MGPGTYILNSYLHGCAVYVSSHVFFNISFLEVANFSVLLPTLGGISETGDEKRAFWK